MLLGIRPSVLPAAASREHDALRGVPPPLCPRQPTESPPCPGGLSVPSGEARRTGPGDLIDHPSGSRLEPGSSRTENNAPTLLDSTIRNVL